LYNFTDIGGQDNVDIMVTCCRLDSQGFLERFSIPVQTGSGAYAFLCAVCTGSVCFQASITK